MGNGDNNFARSISLRTLQSR